MDVPLVVSRHLDHLRQAGLSEMTILKRRQVLSWLAAATGVPALEVTPEMLVRWRAGLAVSNDSIAVYLSHVRSFYAWAADAGLVDADPARRLPVPRMSYRIPRPIGDEDLFAALAAAGPRVRPWLVLAGWAGLRAKEIAYLRRTSVLEHARPPVLLVARDATKGRGERLVPLSEFALRELLPVLPAAGWVFRRGDGQPGPNRPSRISQLANAHLHDCGIAATLHQLRHRFGTQAYRASHDLRVVQELLGHANPSTTAGYAAYDNADAIAAVESLPAPRHLKVVSE
ncbi:MAG TPA: tyrosine-type recombinase/integrase [Streptosporangiaceae bacterium]